MPFTAPDYTSVPVETCVGAQNVSTAAGGSGSLSVGRNVEARKDCTFQFVSTATSSSSPLLLKLTWTNFFLEGGMNVYDGRETDNRKIFHLAELQPSTETHQDPRGLPISIGVELTSSSTISVVARLLSNAQHVRGYGYGPFMVAYNQRMDLTWSVEESECTSDSDCGAGTCVTGTRARCECPSGYSGWRCVLNHCRGRNVLAASKGTIRPFPVGRIGGTIGMVWCSWEINSGGSGDGIVLFRVKSLELGDSSDSLNIYSGIGSSRSLVVNLDESSLVSETNRRSLVKQLTSVPVLTSSPSAVVEFTTSIVGGLGGFELEYEVLYSNSNSSTGRASSQFILEDSLQASSSSNLELSPVLYSTEPRVTHSLPVRCDRNVTCFNGGICTSAFNCSCANGFFGVGCWSPQCLVNSGTHTAEEASLQSQSSQYYRGFGDSCVWNFQPPAAISKSGGKLKEGVRVDLTAFDVETGSELLRLEGLNSSQHVVTTVVIQDNALSPRDGKCSDRTLQCNALYGTCDEKTNTCICRQGFLGRECSVNASYVLYGVDSLRLTFVKDRHNNGSDYEGFKLKATSFAKCYGSANDSQVTANTELLNGCSGHGQCVLGACVCDAGYVEPFCEPKPDECDVDEQPEYSVFEQWSYAWDAYENGMIVTTVFMALFFMCLVGVSLHAYYTYIRQEIRQQLKHSSVSDSSTIGSATNDANGSNVVAGRAKEGEEDAGKTLSTSDPRASTSAPSVLSRVLHKQHATMPSLSLHHLSGHESADGGRLGGRHATMGGMAAGQKSVSALPKMNRANGMVVLSLVMDYLFVVAICLSPRVSWRETGELTDTFVEAIQFTNSGDLFFLNYICLFVIFLWCLYCATFLFHMDEKLSQFYIGELFLSPGLIYLQLVGTIGLVPTVGTLLKLFNCAFVPAPLLGKAVLPGYCGVECFDTEHMVTLVLSGVFLCIFVPMTLATAFFWQELTDGQTILFRRTYIFASQIFFICLILIRTFFTAYPYIFILSASACILLRMTVHLFGHQRFPAVNVPWVDTWLKISYGMALILNAYMLVTHIVGISSGSTWPIFVALGLAVLGFVCVLYVTRRKHPYWFKRVASHKSSSHIKKHIFSQLVDELKVVNRMSQQIRASSSNPQSGEEAAGEKGASKDLQGSAKKSTSGKDQEEDKRGSLSYRRSSNPHAIHDYQERKDRAMWENFRKYCDKYHCKGQDKEILESMIELAVMWEEGSEWCEWDENAGEEVFAYNQIATFLDTAAVSLIERGVWFRSRDMRKAKKRLEKRIRRILEKERMMEEHQTTGKKASKEKGVFLTLSAEYSTEASASSFGGDGSSVMLSERSSGGEGSIVTKDRVEEEKMEEVGGYSSGLVVLMSSLEREEDDNGNCDNMLEEL